MYKRFTSILGVKRDAGISLTTKTVRVERSVYNPSAPSLHAGDNTLVLLKVLVTTMGQNTPTYQIISTTVLPTASTPLDPSSIPNVTKMEIYGSGPSAYLYIGTDMDIYRISMEDDPAEDVTTTQDFPATEYLKRSTQGTTQETTQGTTQETTLQDPATGRTQSIPSLITAFAKVNNKANNNDPLFRIVLLSLFSTHVLVLIILIFFD